MPSTIAGTTLPHRTGKSTQMGMSTIKGLGAQHSELSTRHYDFESLVYLPWKNCKSLKDSLTFFTNRGAFSLKVLTRSGSVSSKCFTMLKK